MRARPSDGRLATRTKKEDVFKNCQAFVALGVFVFCKSSERGRTDKGPKAVDDRTLVLRDFEMNRGQKGEWGAAL